MNALHITADKIVAAVSKTETPLDRWLKTILVLAITSVLILAALNAALWIVADVLRIITYLVNALTDLIIASRHP